MRSALMIRVMAEYGSSGVWGFSKNPSGLFKHGMMEHSELHMPRELQERFERWIQEYETKNLNDTLTMDTFKCRGFRAGKASEGLSGTKSIRGIPR